MNISAECASPLAAETLQSQEAVTLYFAAADIAGSFAMTRESHMYDLEAAEETVEICCRGFTALNYLCNGVLQAVLENRSMMHGVCATKLISSYRPSNDEGLERQNIYNVLIQDDVPSLVRYQALGAESSPFSLRYEHP